eukprot:351281-Chlamydomonas_euryale.AAC.1
MPFRLAGTHAPVAPRKQKSTTAVSTPHSPILLRSGATPSTHTPLAWNWNVLQLGLCAHWPKHVSHEPHRDVDRAVAANVDAACCLALQQAAPLREPCRQRGSSGGGPASGGAIVEDSQVRRRAAVRRRPEGRPPPLPRSDARSIAGRAARHAVGRIAGHAAG